jgi:hypothetical protein
MELLQKMLQDHFAPGASVNRQAWRAYLMESFLENFLGMMENMASKGGATSAGGCGDDTTGSKRQRHE